MICPICDQVLHSKIVNTKTQFQYIKYTCENANYNNNYGYHTYDKSQYNDKSVYEKLSLSQLIIENIDNIFMYKNYQYNNSEIIKYPFKIDFNKFHDKTYQEIIKIIKFYQVFL